MNETITASTLIGKHPVIAAVRSDTEFTMAVKSRAALIFDLDFDIIAAQKKLKAVREAGKHLFIHMDMVRGIGRDESGIRYLGRMGVEGIVSTKIGMIRSAREWGLYTVQRCFVVDSHSIETTVDTLKTARPDLLECMPGAMAKGIALLKCRTDVPLIAGGLIETPDEVRTALASGAAAVSTGKRSLWDADCIW